MAMINLNIYSEALGMQTQVNVVIPQTPLVDGKGLGKNGKYKCLYLLHGLSDDQSIWMRRTSIERYADQYGICVVMPFGARSFYCDIKNGSKYYTYVAKELPKIIQSMFNVSAKREDNYIAGLSMGGYGALKIGLRECGSFCAAAGLSPAVELNRGELTPHLAHIFGENAPLPKEDDLFYLIKKYNKNARKPRLYIGIGTEDFLYSYNVDFRAEMEKLDYDFTYRESKGVHNWYFWDEYIQYVLEWMFDTEKAED